MADDLDIVLFVSSMGGGGAERVASHLAVRWSEEGRRVGVVTLSAAGEDVYALPSDVQRIGLDLYADSHGTWSALRWNARRVLALRRLLRRARPPVALALLTESNILLILAARGLGIRVVVSERNYPPSESLARVWRVLRRHVYGLADIVVAQTGDCARWLDEHTRARRIEIVPNAVVWPLPATSPCVDPDDWLAPDVPIVLAVGRLVPQKGFDLLLEAFASVAPEYPQWKLVILGEGPRSGSGADYADQLRQRAARTDLNGAVIMPGRAGNMARWYARCQVFVLSSRYEGFPNALLEAMAAGIAVLSTRCPAGTSDMVEHDVNGLLSGAGDARALAVELHRLLADAELRARLGQAARGVRTRFSAEGVAARWHDILQLPAAGTARSGGPHERDNP